eukprot:1649255-Amphidinium_carterae.1
MGSLGHLCQGKVRMNCLAACFSQSTKGRNARKRGVDASGQGCGLFWGGGWGRHSPELPSTPVLPLAIRRTHLSLKPLLGNKVATVWWDDYHDTGH